MAHYPNRWLYIALLVALGISTLSEDPKNVFCKGEVVQERNHFFPAASNIIKRIAMSWKKKRETLKPHRQVDMLPSKIQNVYFKLLFRISKQHHWFKFKFTLAYQTLITPESWRINEFSTCPVNN